MVFESIVTDVLNKFVGDYVENLDKKQLKIGIWGGDVVLHNLILRENALDEIQIPLRLIYGSLGKLVLKIPWTNLYSEPVVAHVEDLYLLICPKQGTEYNAEKEAKYELQAKQAELQQLEDARRQEQDKDKPKPDQSFSEKLTAQIVNNIQIKIANVHIRYEDKTTTDHPLAFGITLHRFDIYTTDSNWIKSYMKEQLSKVYKVADLDSLSIYMNCNTSLFSSYTSEVFSSTIATSEAKPEGYSYVIGPISCLTQLQLNMNPQYDTPPFKIPKVLLNLEMQKLNIGITKTQFQALLKVGDSINRMKIAAPYRKYRPYNIPYKGHYKEWWHFAITCVLEHEVRRKSRNWSWEYIKQHRKLINTYAKAYKESKLSSKPTTSVTETCNLCEQKLDMFNLVLVRNRVDLEIEKIKKEEDKKAQKQKSWLSGWWYGSNATDTQESENNFVKKFEAAMTAEEKEKLYAAIGYQENAAQLILPEEYEAIQMRFKLLTLEILVADETTSNSSSKNDLSLLAPIITLKLSTVTCAVDQRPAANAIKVNVGIKEFTLTGFEQKNVVPTIVESQVPDQYGLLEILFETNPIDKKCNQRVNVFARPLLITFDGKTVIKLISVFKTPSNVNLSQLEGAAASKLANIKERSATGMQYLIDKHDILEVNIKCMPNVILIPHSGYYVRDVSSLIVISLGELSVTSDPRATDEKDVQAMARSGKNQENIMQVMMERAYDRFNVNIDNIQVLVAKANEKWSEALQNKIKSPMHVLSPTKLIVTAAVCVIPDDPRLPKTKVKILIPNVGVTVTERRMFEALTIITSLPQKDSDVPEPAPLGGVASSMVSASVMSLTRLLTDKDLRKSETKVELADEIVQYTELELSFTLSEFNVAMYKCKNDDIGATADTPASKDTSSPEKYDTPEVEFRGFIEDVEGSLINHEKILSIKVMQLEATLGKRTYEMVADAKLGAVNVIQHNNWKNGPKDIEIIGTPGYTSKDKEYLLTVSYVNADKESPEFTTKYNSTEKMVVINFSTLVLTVHQECLQQLLWIVDNFKKRFEKMMSDNAAAQKDRIASAGDESFVLKVLDTIQEEDESGENLKVKRISKVRASKKVVGSIKIKLVANLEQVRIEITCLKRPISTLKVRQFSAGVIIKTAYTEVSVKLRDIAVTDLNPHTVHKLILSVVGENAFLCQVVIFNLEQTRSYNSDDIKIDVTMGCVKIIFLNWFVSSMLMFLNNFQEAQQAIANASAAAAETAKQTAVEAYEKAVRIKFNIKIKAPLVIVPINSQSYDALALDFGNLTITNHISEVDIPLNERSPAVIDDMKVKLKEFKLSKVIIEKSEKERSLTSIETKTSDEDNYSIYGLQSRTNIFDPMTFDLYLKRNLTFGWYKEMPQIDISGRLKSIEVNVLVEDYKLVMSIVNKNLPEGQDEFKKVKKHRRSMESNKEDGTVEPTVALVDVHRSESANEGEEGAFAPVKSKPSIAVTTKPSKEVQSKPSQAIVPKESTILEKITVDINLVFNIQVDGLVANLVTSNGVGLATFGLYYLSLKGKLLVDGTLSTSIVLVDIQLDDIRPEKKSTITKYLNRKDNKNKNKITPGTSKDEKQDQQYMLDVTAIIKDKDTFAEVRISGFDLIISIDFLMNIAEFFKLPEDDSKVENKLTTEKVQKKKPQTPATPADPDKKMNIVLHLEEPDIILIESMEDINTHAIIFSMETLLKWRTVGEKQLIFGEIKDLRMYMCSFSPERREATKHYIIHPCTVSLQGSTPEGKGLNISLKVTNIVINISPATLELINKAVRTVTYTESKQEDDPTKVIEYDKIWDVKEFEDNDYWFIKVEEGIEASEVTDLKSEEKTVHKPQVCIVEVPSIVILFAAGIGYYTTPMLYIDIRMGASVHDWSSQMRITGNINLSMSYYNSTLAVWEPMIEENQRQIVNGLSEYGPWELNFELSMEKKQLQQQQQQQQQIDDVDESDENVTKININSKDVLEITVSKSGLELLQMLGEAFSQAFDTKGLIKPDIMSSYILENDTGFEITLNFLKSAFTLHECHLPINSTTSITSQQRDLINSSIKIELIKKDDNIENYIRKLEDVQSCTVLAGGRVYLQKKELDVAEQLSFETVLSSTSEQNQDFLFIKMGNLDKEIPIPVAKADERYFPLYRDTNQEPWGIVSEIKNEYGTTKINIHGVLKIKNHFTTPIFVHKIRKNDKQILVGEVGPGQIFNVPLHGIYCGSKEIYFSLAGYKCSVQGIIWNESLTDMNYIRQIQCDPINTFEPFYINAIREKTEVYFEISSKFTLLSAYYTFHLRPPLYLRNALPIEIRVSVAGCSVRQESGVQKAIEAAEEIADKSVEDDTNEIQSKQELQEQKIEQEEQQQQPDQQSIIQQELENEPESLEANEVIAESKQHNASNREDFLDYGEKTILPGDILHLPTVKLTSKTGDTRSYIVVRLIQYLEKDWSCTTEISKNHDEYAVWTFTSYDSATQMEMELGVRFENRHGSLQLTVYCPFWMLNKTGLMLSYRPNTESINVLYHPPNYEGPVLFSFREKNFFGKKRAVIRVYNGEWSEKIPLDVAGSTGVVECKVDEMTYHIGVHNHLTHNSLTKHITFLPFYVAINKAPFALELQDAHRPADPWTEIPENECIPLWPKIDTKHMLKLRIQGERYISVPFKYTEVQRTLLKMRNKYAGVNVDVQVTEGGVYITFTQYHAGDAPGLIINHTRQKIRYWEKGNVNERKLEPYQQELFTWSDPAGEKIILWDSGKTQIEHDLRRDGVGQVIIGEDEQNKAYWVSFLDSAQRVLLFTERESIAHETESTSKLDQVNQIIEISIYGIGLSLINNVKSVDILYLRIASSGVIWESRKKGKLRFKQMKIAKNEALEMKYQEYLRDRQVGNTTEKYYLEEKLEINFDKMILTKPSSIEKEIQRTFYPGLWLQLKTSPFQLQIHAKINRLQIDNQLYDCIFPVLFAPIAPPKSVAAIQALKPFVECSIVQRVVPHSTLTQFKYFSILIQEFHVKVDLLFVNELLEMFAGEVSDEEAAKKFTEDVNWILKPLVDLVQTSAQQQQKHFFDYLHLGPIKIHVSFSMAGAEAKALPSILSTILQGVGVTLTDVNDVVFRLAFFEREYQFFTQKQLVSEIVTHYAGQAVKQLYVLVLGLDVLGNPYGLVVGIKKGVEDLFYEPFQGAIQGPGEFAEGLVLGVKSLFGHTVGGAAGAVSKITGAMGKGLAALTFDKEYQIKRRQALSKKPTNFQEGIARSGRGLVMGVFDGVTGVFVKPITGAKEDGVEGFFKGFGKGAVGLVARPTAGLVDFASGSLDAVKRATEGSADTLRIRPPRFLHPDGVVRPFCYTDSLGNKILKEIDKGRYAKTDTFKHLEIVVEGREILLISNHRVIYATKNDLFGTYNIHWTYRWPEIAMIRSTNYNLEITLKKEEKRFLFSPSENPKKTVPIQPQTKRDYVAKIMVDQKRHEIK